MIRQVIDLPRWGWRVWVYYAVKTYWAEEIMERLDEIGCQDEDMVTAWRNLTSGKLDTGLTYCNYARRKGVLVIAKTSTAAEFQNSFDHEKGHLCRYICQAEGIDPYGEEAQYLAGEIGQRMFPVAQKFLCDCCRSRGSTP